MADLFFRAFDSVCVMRAGRTIALVLLTSCLACSEGRARGGDVDSGAPDASGAGDAGDDAGPSAPADFEVRIWEAESATDGSRIAFAGAGRSAAEEAVDQRVGDCSLLLPEAPPFCDPPCDPGTICVGDGACEAPPPAIGVGDITVTGLKAALTMHPETEYHYYVGTFVPEPADGDVFDAGAEITASAAGDDLPAFTVTGLGVADLASTLACPLTFVDGGALEVHWTPGEQPGDRIRFGLQSGNHGAQFAHIVCDTADSGALTVDATLLATYLSESRPVESWSLSRRREAHRAAGSAVVALITESDVACRW